MPRKPDSFENLDQYKAYAEQIWDQFFCGLEYILSDKEVIATNKFIVKLARLLSSFAEPSPTTSGEKKFYFYMYNSIPWFAACVDLYYFITTPEYYQKFESTYSDYFILNNILEINIVRKTWTPYSRFDGKFKQDYEDFLRALDNYVYLKLEIKN